MSAAVLLAVFQMVLNLFLLVTGALGLTAWRREKDFAIARGLYLSLFALDREATALRSKLEMSVLRDLARFTNGEPVHGRDYEADRERLRERCGDFQIALVEAAARWQTDFGLGPIGRVTTYSLEYAIGTMIVFAIGLQTAEQSEGGSRQERSSDLRRRFSEVATKSKNILEDQRRAFYEGIAPRIERHFVSRRFVAP